MKTKIIQLSIKETFVASKQIFIGVYSCFLLGGILKAMPIMLIQQLFDEVTHINDNPEVLHKVFFIIALLFATKVAIQILSSVGDYLYENQDLVVAHNLTKGLNDKLNKISPVLFEDKNFLEQKEKAYEGIRWVRKLADTMLMILLNYVPSIIVLTIYLYQSHKLLPLLLIFIFIPVILVQKIQVKSYTKLEDTLTPINRKSETYTKYITNRTHFKEVRSLGLYRYFKNKLVQTLQNRNAEFLKVELASQKLTLITKFISLCGYMGILIFLYVLVQRGDISIGYFAGIFTALHGLFNMIEALVYQMVGDTSKVVGKINNYFEFKNYPEIQTMSKKLETSISIDMQNVSFSYPNSDYKALDNVSLNIGDKQTVIIVGENGSGKTTLGRLIAGLYKPTDGHIMYNNLELDKNEFLPIKNMSAVFQNFGKYQMTLEENIHLGEVLPNKTVANILEQVDISLDKKTYPQNVDTLLSREFGGVDISGGQWQKIAIARAFYKHSDLIFLDEPTSVIDPLEESNMYNKFKELVADKTAIIVTHRMSVVKMADKIVVMKNGKILDVGQHENLLERCAYYKKLWLAQQEQYQS
ncbi:MAG: hypothetical protein ATN35_02795 [Epulopiscium sp. Nele67-Bin004]|nr:MAG: hypothetical protein ATN35_02795 [Epulopiscium sp. Nele67-Bin004]